MTFENCRRCNKPRWTRNNAKPCKNCRRKLGDLPAKRVTMKRVKKTAAPPPPKNEKKSKKGK